MSIDRFEGMRSTGAAAALPTAAKSATVTESVKPRTAFAQFEIQRPHDQVELTREQTVSRFKSLLAAKESNLEEKDRLGNFEIQRLMSQYNQAETLASSVLKKSNDTASAVIGKI